VKFKPGNTVSVHLRLALVLYVKKYVDFGWEPLSFWKFTKMTAHDQIRAMLDQLMGTGRNGKYL